MRGAIFQAAPNPLSLADLQSMKQLAPYAKHLPSDHRNLWVYSGPEAWTKAQPTVCRLSIQDTSGAKGIAL